MLPLNGNIIYIYKNRIYQNRKAIEELADFDKSQVEADKVYNKSLTDLSESNKLVVNYAAVNKDHIKKLQKEVSKINETLGEFGELLKYSSTHQDMTDKQFEEMKKKIEELEKKLIELKN